MKPTPRSEKPVPQPLEDFLLRLSRSLDSDAFVKLTLSEYRGEVEALRNLYARPVLLKEGRRMQYVWRYATRDVTQNEALGKTVAEVRAALATGFRRAHLFTTTGDFQLRLDGGGGGALKASRPAFTVQADEQHDRPKTTAIDTAAPFLQKLGGTNALGEPRPGMAGKLRQVERFVELLGHAFDAASVPPKASASAIDMGAGKGYLTFALADFLRRRGLDHHVIGVELRKDLVESSNALAKELGFERLRFELGAIGAFAMPPQTDLLIALHACDTATDDAIHQGIQADAGFIMVAPCCHKEVRAQIVPPEPLVPVLRHGILLEREAETVTDAIRALVLEIHGYKASVFEFISPEHTGKNVMITAQRRTSPGNTSALKAQLADLLHFYGIKRQRLVELVGGIATSPETPNSAPTD